MDEGLAAIAASRGGPFRVREAVAAGYGRHAIRRLIDTGVWVRLRPGILAAADPLTDPDPARRHAVYVAAALLALGPPVAVASHESAAVLHGIALLREHPPSPEDAPSPEGARPSNHPPSREGAPSPDHPLSREGARPSNHPLSREGAPSPDHPPSLEGAPPPDHPPSPEGAPSPDHPPSREGAPPPMGATPRGARPVGESVSLTRPPGGVHRDRIRGGRVHRAELPAAHVGRRYGVPVTSPARTVADLARRLPYRDAVVAADSAMFRRLTHRAEIEDVLGACAGWPGSGAAARVLATADPAARGPLATLARLMCAAAGLPKPRAGARVGGGPGPHAVADLYWREHRVIVLLDDPLDADPPDADPPDADPATGLTERPLQARLERDHFIVVRLTWADVTGHPARSTDRIRAALARRGRR